MKPHSYLGRIAKPREGDTLDVEFCTIVNDIDGTRRTFRSVTTTSVDASLEELAEAFGEAARLSFLAASRQT